MTWTIAPREDGGGVITHGVTPRFIAHWMTGDDPDELTAIDGALWTDNGAGQGDQIRLYRFVWIDQKPDQKGFEELMRKAALAIDGYVSFRLSD